MLKVVLVVDIRMYDVLGWFMLFNFIMYCLEIILGSMVIKNVKVIMVVFVNFFWWVNYGNRVYLKIYNIGVFVKNCMLSLIVK